MISQHDALEIQSFVDGELPRAQAERVGRRLESDPEARALSEELRLTRAWVRSGEAVARLEDSREFYWSRIRTGIERVERQGRPASSWAVRAIGLWRFAAATCVALAAAAFLIFPHSPTDKSPEGWLAVDQEIESPLENANTFSFRSESARMTVVWVNTQVN